MFNTHAVIVKTVLNERILLPVQGLHRAQTNGRVERFNRTITIEWDYARTYTKTQALLDTGVDHVVIDSGSIAEQVRGIFPGGVGGAVELVGTPTLQDTVRATAVHGTVCFTGMLSDEWTVKDFYPSISFRTGSD